MSTATTVNKSTIIRRLKTNAAALVHLRHKADLLESHIYADTYLWTTAAIVDGTARDITHACQILADTLKTHSSRTIGGWAWNGKFMAEKNLPADKTDRRAVNEIASYQKSIPKSTMLQLVDMMKKGRPYRDIKSRLRNEAPSGDISKKAVHRVVALRRGTAFSDDQLLKLEMRVVEGLARKVYGKAVYIILEDGDGNVLETSDRKRPTPIEARRRKNEECRHRREAKETPEEREARLKSCQKRDLQRYKDLTSEQRRERSRRECERRKQRLKNENLEKREARLKKNRAYRARKNA